MERFAYAIACLAPHPADHILEIGCGTGQAAVLLHPLIPQGELYLIDRSDVMLKKAAKKLPASVLKERADFPDWKSRKKFDKIFAFNVSDSWGNTGTAFLRAIAAHLAADGQCWLFHQGPPGSVERLNKEIRIKLKELATGSGLVMKHAEEKMIHPSPVLAVKFVRE